MKMKDLKGWQTEKISQRVFYVLIGLAVLVFGLFFLVGYSMPFEENPDFNAPLFTDVLIVLMWLLLLLTLGLAVYSIVKGYRLSVKEEKLSNGIPENKIFRITWLSTLAVLVLTFLVGSSMPMLINGSEFGDWIWLKVSDMFVTTSILMLVAAFGAVLFGATRYIRKERH